jgi:hypothetical protein
VDLGGVERAGCSEEVGISSSLIYPPGFLFGWPIRIFNVRRIVIPLETYDLLPDRGAGHWGQKALTLKRQGNRKDREVAWAGWMGPRDFGLYMTLG